MLLTPIETKLLESGYDSFSLADKNLLISTLANREGVTYSAITDSYILDHHKNLKTDILSDECEELIVNGFTATNGHKYRTNRDDQMNMIGKRIQLMLKPEIIEVNWKTEDVGYLKLTRDEWIRMYDEAFAHKEATLFKYNTLKMQVQEATTDAEVLAVKWEVSAV
jgi:hypothetical protein